MQFFVESNAFLHKATETEALIKQGARGIVDALDAVKDLRDQYRQIGGDGWSADRQWRHVASIYAPIMECAEFLDPEFIRDKRKVYRWLDHDDHKRWVTYDRRKQSVARQATFVDGKAVI